MFKVDKDLSRISECKNYTYKYSENKRAVKGLNGIMKYDGN